KRARNAWDAAAPPARKRRRREKELFACKEKRHHTRITRGHIGHQLQRPWRRPTPPHRRPVTDRDAVTSTDFSPPRVNIMIFSWLRELFGQKGLESAARRRPQPGRRKKLDLRAELLEDRLTPATYNWNGSNTLSIALGSGENLTAVNTGGTNPAVTFT